MPLTEVAIAVALAWAGLTAFVVALCVAAKSGDRALGYDRHPRGERVVSLADVRARRAVH